VNQSTLGIGKVIATVNSDVAVGKRSDQHIQIKNQSTLGIGKVITTVNSDVAVGKRSVQYIQINLDHHIGHNDNNQQKCNLLNGKY
jgi:hypothetical protein